MLSRVIIYGALSLGILGVCLHALHQKNHGLLTQSYPACRLTIPIQNGQVGAKYLNQIMSDPCCDGVMAIQWTAEHGLLRVVHHE